MSVFLSTILTLTYFYISLNCAQLFQGKNIFLPNSVEQLPKDKPVVVIVPLNGVPHDDTHDSYKNAKVALDFIKKLPVKEKYIVLSEGRTDSWHPCIAGAEQTALWFSLQPGYNSRYDVTLLLDNNAVTTVENIQESNAILQKRFNKKPVTVLIAGSSDNKSILGKNIDIGHVSRAYILAKQQFLLHPSFSLEGIIPTNVVDTTIQGYSSAYNATTMTLATSGLLYLPYFDKHPVECSNLPN